VSIIDSFRWTSREDACEQLISFLFSTKSTATPTACGARGPRAQRDPHDWHRTHAAGLLITLATPAIAGPLRRLLLDRAEASWVRIYSARALVAVGEGVSTEELAGLFAEERTWRAEQEANRWACATWRPEPLGFDTVLSLCRTDADRDIARAEVSHLSAEGCASLLLGRMASHVDGWLREPIYRKWLGHVPELPVDEVLEVARLTDDHFPESRALVLAAWRAGPTERRLEMVPWLRGWEDRVALLRGDPAVWADAIERLDLPLGELVEALGPDELQARIDAWLRESSKALERERHDHETRFEPIRVARLLEKWRPEAIEACLGWPDHHPLVVRALENALWKCDRERAVAWAVTQLDHDPATRRGERILECLAGEPEPRYCSLLGLSLSARNPAHRWLALHALEARGQNSSAWRSHLERATHDEDRFVAIRGHGALARRGSAESARALETLITVGECVLTRAEAVRWRGAVDPPALLLLEHALLHDHEHVDDYHTPVDEEAAFAIARVGTDEALTALVRGGLASESNPLTSAVEEYLAVLLARRAGSDEELEPLWRQARYPGHASSDWVERAL
jgi:hypothetical protein